MKREWYLLVGKEKEGPFTLNELLAKKEFTKESWVWKEGMKEWKRAKDVPALAFFFEKEKEELKEEVQAKAPVEDLTLAISSSEPPWFLLFIILLVVALYAWFLFFNN